MIIAVLGSESKIGEFRSLSFVEQHQIIEADSMRSFTAIEADVYFMLDDITDINALTSLTMLSNNPLVVNSVAFTSSRLGKKVIRMNGWSTMINRSVAEISISLGIEESSVQNLFEELGWTCEIVPDIPGFVVPRIICQVINEAYFTVESGVSTKDEIDIAMKLGTHYPFGPFEWSRKIGLKNVKCLLNELASGDSRYETCALLAAEASE